MDDKVLKAVRRRAAGYKSKEVVEEYAAADGQLTLVKRKITTKEVPPDVAAVRLLKELMPTDRELSYEEIERERVRLLKTLKEMENGDNTE